MAQGLTGTPLYMSPEAIAESTLVDGRTDLYALGAVGYFLLTGTPVFEGSNVLEICRKHIEVTPERPSARMHKPVSPDLEAIVMKCLAKSPNDRPATARDLLRSLNACQVQVTWTEDDATAWWQSVQTLAAATTAVLPTHSDKGAATIDISQ
jgi:serine/threonine protein kinase